MKHNAIIRQLLFPALCLLGLLATSCIHEDLEECYTLRLRAENIKGEDVTGLGYVSAASLYIFDENLNYLETRVLDKDFIISHDEIVLDNYPASQKLNIVAWGNVNVLGDKQEVSESKRIEDLKVMLKSQNSLAVLPDSLYFGIQQVQTKASGGITENKEIVVHPKVGSVTIETINLKYGLRSKGISSVNECDFYLNRTLSGFDYQGEQIGDSVYYNPASVPNDKNTGEWKTPNLSNRFVRMTVWECLLISTVLIWVVLRTIRIISRLPLKPVKILISYLNLQKTELYRPVYRYVPGAK